MRTRRGRREALGTMGSHDEGWEVIWDGRMGWRSVDGVDCCRGRHCCEHKWIANRPMGWNIPAIGTRQGLFVCKLEG